jgi:Phage integrase family
LKQVLSSRRAYGRALQTVVLSRAYDAAVKYTILDCPFTPSNHPFLTGKRESQCPQTAPNAHPLRSDLGEEGHPIRASEWASLRNADVDLKQLTIKVQGKGGHERSLPLNPEVAELLRTYVATRGPAPDHGPFFRSRFGRGLSRISIYERVRIWGQRSRLGIPQSPHRIRHYSASRTITE